VSVCGACVSVWCMVVSSHGAWLCLVVHGCPLMSLWWCMCHCVCMVVSCGAWLPTHTANTLSLQHTATHCNTLQHTATHCNTLQHTATHCNTLHHTAPHCNILQHTATYAHTQVLKSAIANGHTPTHTYCQYSLTATHCKTLQHTATHCNTLQHTATQCNVLQRTTPHQTHGSSRHQLLPHTPLWVQWRRRPRKLHRQV